MKDKLAECNYMTRLCKKEVSWWGDKPTYKTAYYFLCCMYCMQVWGIKSIHETAAANRTSRYRLKRIQTTNWKCKDDKDREMEEETIN